MALGGAQRADPAVELGQGQAGVLLEEQARLGQPQPPPDPLEERDAEPCFQLAKGFRYRRLRDREDLRRLADACQPRYLDEATEVPIADTDQDNLWVMIGAQTIILHNRHQQE